ncbi:MAG: hypothetical protein M0009_14245 [Deltaproteobacteria bacterium]|nr:hypothetical protein [Deltaproteobacteria bacterium]
MRRPMRSSWVRSWGMLALVVAALGLWQGRCEAITYMCQSNPDYFSKRCTVHPFSITKVVDGVVEKGHLVGCQFKSYSCLKQDGKYQCRDNYGTTVIPFDFSMNDLKGFCNLLCTNPVCTTGWE